MTAEQKVTRAEVEALRREHIIGEECCDDQVVAICDFWLAHDAAPAAPMGSAEDAELCAWLEQQAQRLGDDELVPLVGHAARLRQAAARIEQLALDVHMHSAIRVQVSEDSQRHLDRALAAEARCAALEPALRELIACDAIVKAGDGRRVRACRWSKAWSDARAAIDSAIARGKT